MQIKERMAVIEAILFATGEPIELERLSESSGTEPETVEKLIRLLNDRYEENESALRILKLGNSYQLATMPEFSEYIRSAMETKRNVPLSAAALEALTIVAYNQPVTKSFVEHIRGVDSSGVINSLVEKNLLEEAGRLDVPGRPVAYKTTATFLRSFKLSSIEELPPLPDKDGQISFDELLLEEENQNKEG